ncbi:hypothetical protein DM01DRAFT_1102306 [Hesseltinella vesiculosa]|uniref:Uncharacterized protein n=1 Tax=Hesseltinella vesiculosa TaxID=101127 RepID=A0A1X2GCN4_9FUNG|nr:hypothetical protein DM01DRAFT_1102306 [Hesseltinella vesiculosa]
MALYVLIWAIVRFGAKRLLAATAGVVHAAVCRLFGLGAMLLDNMYGLVLLACSSVYVCLLFVVFPVVFFGGIGMICLRVLAKHLWIEYGVSLGIAMRNHVIVFAAGLGCRFTKGPITRSNVTGLGTRPLQGLTITPTLGSHVSVARPSCCPQLDVDVVLFAPEPRRPPAPS